MSYIRDSKPKLWSFKLKKKKKEERKKQETLRKGILVTTTIHQSDKGKESWIKPWQRFM